MKLYHGSNIAVSKPEILVSDRKLDFGTGFYLTSSSEQARKNFSPNRIISVSVRVLGLLPWENRDTASNKLVFPWALSP